MSAPIDPEAEQEVDFGRYWRLIGNRWWVPIAGLVVGAVIGYLIALGGNQVFKATATLYLGQPYTASGNSQLQSAQTNPSAVRVIAHADPILEEGWTPNMIVGDMDSATDRVLRCGAELVVHAYPDGRAPGRDRLDTLGLDNKVVRAPATSEYIAMLMAAEKGAQLIVTVGSHFNLVEFLDKNRSGMSSTFLTRLRVGEILVDAKGVSRLYRPSAGRGPILLLTLAAFITFVIVVATSSSLGALLDLLWLKLQILLGLK